MRVLLVGPGAVGQVFGLGLQAAGAELAFYARPASATRLIQALEDGGLPLYQLSHRHRRQPIAHRLDRFQVVTSAAESRQFAPDQIWFATPSPVFYSAWFREFLDAVPAATVLCFAPEGGRPEFLPASGGDERLVFGGITFLAWQGMPDADAGLAGGGERPGGVHFWRPPLEIPLMGPEKGCAAAAAILKQAGFRPAVKKPAFQKSLAAVTAVITAFVAGLELSGWTFKAFRRGPWLQPAARAAREAAAGQLAPAGFIARLLPAVLLSSPGLFLATFQLRPLFPFDLERYLQFHYQKTRNQTLALLAVFAGDADRLSLPAANIRLLQEALPGRSPAAQKTV